MSLIKIDNIYQYGPGLNRKIIVVGLTKHEVTKEELVIYRDWNHCYERPSIYGYYVTSVVDFENNINDGTYKHRTIL
jgi:hypothetical protein